MKHSPRERLRQGLRAGTRLARRASADVKDRLPSRVGTATSADEQDDELSPVSESGEGQVSTPPASPGVQLKQVRRRHREALAELEALTDERDVLRAERLAVQQKLGEQHGKRVMPRLKVEKTNGTPSFVVAQRMMQRVNRRALDPFAGLDRVGAVFAATNPQGTAKFAASHGVPVSPTDPEQTDEAAAGQHGAQLIVVHAFKGEVGLVEVRGGQSDEGVQTVRHFDSTGEDPGDIRPAFTYDPSIEVPAALADICGWACVLSAHIPRPYVQLIFSREDGGSFLDGIEVDPDRIPVLTPDWDERLGGAFDSAYSRFLLQPYSAGGLDNRVPGGTFIYEEAR